jgi:hypothetical protein
MKIRPVEFDLFHAGGRTDGQTELTKLIFALLDFAGTPNNASIVYCETQLDHTLIIAFYHITRYVTVIGKYSRLHDHYTFCNFPHSLSMYLQQRYTVSLNSINWLLYRMCYNCVYWD